MMENGELLAADVLPKVAIEMRKMANAGGALEQKLMTTRVQQGRFFKELETAQNIIFKSGFDKGLANMFNSLANGLVDSKKGLEGLGKTFKWFFDTVALGVKIIMPVLDSFFFVTGEVFGAINNLNNFLGNNFFSTALLVTGALLGITKIFKSFPVLAQALPFLGRGFKTVGKDAAKSTSSVVIFGHAIKGALRAPLTIALLVIAALDEIFSLFTKGRVGVLEEFLFGGKDIGFDSIEEFIDYLNNLDLSELGGKVGNAIYEGLKWVFLNMTPAALFDPDSITSKMVKSLTDGLSRINWGAVLQNFGATLAKTWINLVISFISIGAGLLEGLIREIPTMGDFEITDSIGDWQKGINKSLDSLYSDRDMIESKASYDARQSMKVEGLTVDGYSGKENSIPKTDDTKTTPPAMSAVNTNQTYNKASTNDNSKVNKTVSNSVTVNYTPSPSLSDNNFGNQSAIADDIAAKVEEMLNKSFTDAELSNGS